MTTGAILFQFYFTKYINSSMLWYLCIIMEMLVPLLLFFNIMGIVSIGWFCSRRRPVENRVNMQEYDEERIMEDISESENRGFHRPFSLAVQ